MPAKVRVGLVQINNSFSGQNYLPYAIACLQGYAEQHLTAADRYEFLLPLYDSEGKAYVTVGIGCTGGRHRSVAMAEELAAQLTASGREVNVEHRDVDAVGDQRLGDTKADFSKSVVFVQYFRDHLPKFAPWCTAPRSENSQTVVNFFDDTFLRLIYLKITSLL